MDAQKDPATKDHSPARTSAKSFPTASTKTISKLVAPKAVCKSQSSLFRTGNPKMTSEASTKKSTSTLSGTSPNTAKTQLKSKIPAMKGSPSSMSTTSNKLRETAKTQGKTQSLPQKTNQQRTTAATKAPQIKPDCMRRSNSKSSLSTTESSLVERVTANNSKSGLAKTAKSLSARSSSESPKSGANKRSASILSTRSIPCARRKEEQETNLRKMISTAGDHKEIDNTEKNTSPEQKLLLPKSKPVQDALKQNKENLKVNSTENFKSPEVAHDFRNKIKSCMDEWFSNLKEELNTTEDTNLIDMEKVEQLQILQNNNILSLIDDWCAATVEGCDLQMLKLKRQLEDSNKSLRTMQEKYEELGKQQDENCLKWEKELEQQVEAEREQIKELQRKLKTNDKQTKTLIQNMEKQKEHLLADKNQLQEELDTCKECFTTTNAKLQATEQQLSQLKRELRVKVETIKKFESDLLAKNDLETHLLETTAKLKELENNLKEKSHNECVEHVKQIAELTNRVNCLASEKETMLQQNEKLEQELIALTRVREQLVETETKLQQLQNDCDNKLMAAESVPDYSKEVQLEFAKCRQSDCEKRREIDKLKVELSKCQFNMCQLEQQIQRDQQLLEVRSELINSLQSNEKTHRIHMEELFAQVGEKNSTINELNRELQSKSEEFRNLFTTLSAKQMEVANQEHIIKLLEESNERSQMLRVKQEEKIGRMEEELAHLKQTIAIYQTNILSGKNAKHLLFSRSVLPASNVDCNENFYYYVSERKRKRQVDINVKKYEA